jgi:PPOX class probable F420-dependent enzyme
MDRGSGLCLRIVTDAVDWQTAPMGYNDAPEGWWPRFVGALPARTAKLAVVRADGSPHVAPVWVDLDGDDAHGWTIVFMTSADTIKGKAILRDPRVCLCFDDEAPPFSFVTIAGTATTSTDADELLYWGTRIGGRYMGVDQAEAYGRRNAVPPEMVVRVTPNKVTAKVDVAS